MHSATRRGAAVCVLTVLAGDPGSSAPADDSNRRAGFGTVGAAARARRAEDAQACRRLGVTPVWLPYGDDESVEMPAEHLLWESICPHVQDADLVLLPGTPLRHVDHRWVHDSLADRLAAAGLVTGLYQEQPYATWDWSSTTARPGRRDGTVLPRPLGERVGGTVLRFAARPDAYAAKYRACTAYRSQLRVLRRAPLARIAAFEVLAGGEWLALPAAAAARWSS